MADDGMFLNFSVDENTLPAASASLQKFKGGSWRDRLKAKRSARRVGKEEDGHKRTNDPNSIPISQRRNEIQGQKHTQAINGAQTDDFHSSRPAKRRRENGYVPDSSTTAATGQRRSEERHATSRSREVISSLFTYNPKPATIEEPKTNALDEPIAPSNAPLIDGIDTFTSLGLSSTIAAHLLTKMNLKTPTAIQKAAISQMLKDPSDAFIQSETGSGKTLAYLLPLVQRIMTLSEQIKAEQQEMTKNPSLLHRDSGLFAIILAPTRELCKQISVVLERLLGCARYIVAGHVLGGEKKKSEKARLRKGLNILVATPGRLVDHLENTKALDVSNVRWLVLDEGDRLVDLGFEEDITKIVKTLDQRKEARETRGTAKWPGLPGKRTTVLCSATLKMNVQKLGEISLKDAMLIKGDVEGDGELTEEQLAQENGTATSAFLAPAQLKQSYIMVAAKLRFVTLAALLKRTFARKGSVMKAIVFLSCADSVEFHFQAFTSALEGEDEEKITSTSSTAKPIPPKSNSGANTSPEPPPNPSTTSPSKPTTSSEPPSHAPSPTLSTPSNPLTIYKLHGSLPQPTRTATLHHFTSITTPSLLLATDVASRGLDLPNLDLVIEYDPAFSAEDHLHRIGRTARLGRDGRAIIFLLPGKEEGYISVLKSSYKSPVASLPNNNVTSLSADEVLKKGFSPSSGVVPTKKSKSTQTQSSSTQWETSATQFQLSLERLILTHPPLQSLARKAFQSHIRAYATHTSAERLYFDIKDLHLGHLCKSFGLRETPQGVGAGRGGAMGGKKGEKRRRKDGEGEGEKDAEEAARKMREKVRDGRRRVMGGGGVEEFNIA